MNYSAQEIRNAVESILGEDTVKSLLRIGKYWPNILNFAAVQVFIKDGKYEKENVDILRAVLLHLDNGGYLPEGM